MQEPPLLRTVIAASAALTLLYTPLLKQLTWIKNACVAAVVAASPFAGALAARAVSPEPCMSVLTLQMLAQKLMQVLACILPQELFPRQGSWLQQNAQDSASCLLQEPLGLQAVMVPCLFVFGGVFYREILMDLNDSEGDRRNKIWTLPVVFGEFAVLTCVLLVPKGHHQTWYQCWLP